jgi:hypothetical protein
MKPRDLTPNQAAELVRAMPSTRSSHKSQRSGHERVSNPTSGSDVQHCRMGVHRNGLCVDSMNPTPLQIATTPSGIHIAYLDKSHRYKIGHDDEGVARSEVTMNFYAATAQIIPILLFTVALQLRLLRLPLHAKRRRSDKPPTLRGLSVRCPFGLGYGRCSECPTTTSQDWLLRTAVKAVRGFSLSACSLSARRGP